MLACDQKIPPTPQIPNLETVKLRIKLVEEETAELLRDLYLIEYWLEKPTDAVLPQDMKLRILTAIAKEVADVVYVVNGTSAAFGIDGERVFEIVHESNMQKSTGPRREDGKVMKPVGWVPPEPAISNTIQNK